jgi:endonuclease/exonuclease/phosphatase family metal-dependent hydrolase
VRRPLLPIVVGSLALAACGDDVTAPTVDADLHHGFPRSAGITVLTRNAYIGTNVDAVIAALMSADPNDDFDTLLAAIATLQATDLPTRAAAFAEEIARTRPDVVGFQEITQLNLHLGPLGVPVDLDLDFLPVIQAALADRGLSYVVGGQVKNIEVALLGGAIHLVDYDVVLYNAERAQWQTVVAKNFEYNVGEVIPGVVLRRGYVLGAATIGDAVYTVVSTHLEPDLNAETPLGDLRFAQMTEIVTALGDAEPAIVMGDLNDQPGSLMYQVLTGAGLADVWAELRPRQPGYTCCHLPDLSNRREAFDQRIDYVFARGFDRRRRDVNGQVVLVGDDRRDRVQGPLYRIWPSDHAGVAARLLLPFERHHQLGD